jgi:hypothetical protein
MAEGVAEGVVDVVAAPRCLGQHGTELHSITGLGPTFDCSFISTALFEV